MSGASDNVTVGGDLPQWQFPQHEVTFQYQPVQRDLAVDILMSRLDWMTPPIGLSRPHETATDTGDATMSDELNDFARPIIRGIGGRQDNPYDVVLEKLSCTV